MFSPRALENSLPHEEPLPELTQSFVFLVVAAAAFSSSIERCKVQIMKTNVETRSNSDPNHKVRKAMVTPYVSWSILQLDRNFCPLTKIVSPLTLHCQGAPHWRVKSSGVRVKSVSALRAPAAVKALNKYDIWISLALIGLVAGNSFRCWSYFSNQ